jgi:hypothetical protein
MLTLQGKTLTLSDWVKLYSCINLKSVNTRYNDSSLSDDEKLFGKGKLPPEEEYIGKLKNIVDSAVSYALPSITSRIVKDLEHLAQLEFQTHSAAPTIYQVIGGDWHSSLFGMTVGEALNHGSTPSEVVEILREEVVSNKANRLQELGLEADNESDKLTIREIRQLLSLL